MTQTIISDNIVATLGELLDSTDYDRVFLLTDCHVQHHVLTVEFCTEIGLAAEQLIVVQAGDEHKTVQTASEVWQALCERGATRHSLLINLGGGMITDLGGFVAATFKRGIHCVNVSTTLLGAVDAAIGGKTGVNFAGLKNEVGVFREAQQVVLAAQLFRTLDAKNLRSGFAEMVKHALISTPDDWTDILRYDIENPDLEALNPLLARNVAIKQRIVEQDPTEQHIRKALNLGHTVGHALESYSYQSGLPVLHGYAVLWGVVAEVYLSHVRKGFPKGVLSQLVQLMKEVYGKPAVGCKQYDQLLELMTHDKKNASADEINFTLLSDVGEIHINQVVGREEICEALDFLIHC